MPEATVFKEVAMDGAQELEGQAEEGLPKEYPVTLVVKGPSSAFDISPTQRTSSPSSLHYAMLLSARPSRSLMGALVPGLNYGNNLFFVRFPLAKRLEQFYNRVLSVEATFLKQAPCYGLD